MSTRLLQAVCHGALENLVFQTSGVESAAIVTGDGFEIASILRNGISVEKLAAMVSSLLALSEAVASEMGKDRCQYVIVDTESGALVTVRIPAFWSHAVASQFAATVTGNAPPTTRPK